MQKKPETKSILLYTTIVIWGYFILKNCVSVFARGFSSHRTNYSRVPIFFLFYYSKENLRITIYVYGIKIGRGSVRGIICSYFFLFFFRYDHYSLIAQIKVVTLAKYRSEMCGIYRRLISLAITNGRARTHCTALMVIIVRQIFARSFFFFFRRYLESSKAGTGI